MSKSHSRIQSVPHDIHAQPEQAAPSPELPVAGVAPHAAPYDALVLDARLRQSLVCVRSLGRRGLRVAAVGTCGSLPTFASRWCRLALACPAHEGTAAFMAYLDSLLLKVDAPVLIASSDATVAMIRKHRARLERRTTVALASDAALDAASNKECTLGIASKLGLATPRCVRALTVSDVSGAVREIGLPAVVKPALSCVCGGQRCASLASQLVTTIDEARAAVDQVQVHGVPMLFQEYLGGRREAVMLLYVRGKLHARFAQWARRTMPPLGGVSVMRQSIEVPADIGDQAETLVRELDLEGYSEVEFRRDDMGKPYLMEINPRLSASVEVAVRSGVDFPHLLYQWASGRPIDEVKGYRVGRWMRHLGGDLRTTWLAMRYEHGRPGVPTPTRALLDFCRDCLTSAGYDYLEWRDPLPACRATIEFVRNTLRR